MSVRTWLLITLLAAPLATVAGPDLPPAPFAAPAAGTVIHRHNTANGKRTKTVFKGVDGYQVRFERNGKAASRVLFCYGCGHEEMHFPEDEYAKLWPLQVGKVVEFKRKRNAHAWMERVEVVGTDTLDLGFGPVDTYVVQHVSRGLTSKTKPWSAQVRIWYAPSFRWEIKNEGQWENKDTGKKNEWLVVTESHRAP